MKRRYYMQQYLNFGNAYNLYWTDDPDDAACLEAYGARRITRKEAEELARAEAQRRKDDPSRADYAGCYVYPYSVDDIHDGPHNPRLYASGRVLELKNSLRS